MKKRRRQEEPLKLNRRKKAIIPKEEPLDLEFLSAIEKTLPEWTSDNDERAYGNL